MPAVGINPLLAEPRTVPYHITFYIFFLRIPLSICVSLCAFPHHFRFFSHPLSVALCPAGPFHLLSCSLPLTYSSISVPGLFFVLGCVCVFLLLSLSSLLSCFPFLSCSQNPVFWLPVPHLFSSPSVLPPSFLFPFLGFLLSYKEGMGGLRKTPLNCQILPAALKVGAMVSPGPLGPCCPSTVWLPIPIL